MSDESRIDGLRRRIEQDPGSIAFAQLAEEHRRAGQPAEAIAVARAGLRLHPGYASARVTLGRALMDLGDLDAARAELEQALRDTPDNPAATRALADLHQRRTASPTPSGGPNRAAVDRAERIVAALQTFLTAIHGSRTDRSA